MEIRKQKQKITITHNLKKGQTYRIQKGESIESFTILTKPQVVSGYSNITDKNKGILLADYDGVDKSVVVEDYLVIQKKFKLPPSYLFQTNKGFHVVCLKTFLHSEIFTILNHMRIDDNYRTMPLRTPFRSYVLRISPKNVGNRPKPVSIIGEEINLNHEVSKAHFELIKMLYPRIYHPNYTKFDGGSKVRMQLYETK